MTEINDEVYSIIFSALKHGVRRRILWMLSEGQKSFTNLYETLEITSSHLNYHLESLGELVSKDNGSYKLSIFGKAAVDMMKNIESPPKLGVFGFEQNRLRIISSVLLICLLTVSGLLANEYVNPKNSESPLQVSASEIEEASSFFPGLANLLSETYSGNSITIQSKKVLNYHYEAEWRETRAHENVDALQNSVMIFYVPVDNSTLNLVSIHGYMTEIVSLPLTIQYGNALNNESAVMKKEGYIKEEHYKIWQSKILWSINTTGTGDIYDINIPESGWYTLCLTGPITYSGTDPDVWYMWGERESWVDIEGIYVNVYCKLQKDGKDILFAEKEHEDFGVCGFWLGDLLPEAT